ncbi:MAG: hypothetical protein ACU837_03590 [Gammaproteobacteria bacterium]
MTDTIIISGKHYSVEQILKEKDEHVKLEAVDRFFALHELARDTSTLVRIAVARKGVEHDRLAFDKDYRVRATVAKYCSDKELLDHLLKDENEFVRFIIAKRGHGFEYLINDPDEEVASLARYGLQEADKPKRI